MTTPKVICVFCGSSLGNDASFLSAARSLGATLAKENIRLVYGGGTRGLMGATAKAVYEAGGSIHGIMPRALLSYERQHAQDMPQAIRQPDEFVEGSHSRSMMHSLYCQEGVLSPASRICTLAFIVDSYGTLEELAEMVTWTQLGLHKKPVILLNVNGFYTSLRNFVDTAIKSGFIAAANRSFLTVVDEPSTGEWGEAALHAIAAWQKSGLGGGQQIATDWTLDG